MKILTVDIGTGTQDIYLYDSRLNIENGYKMIVPSPTMMIHQQIQSATRNGKGILLQGSTMGGGPNNWATENHLKAGLQVYATENAAKSFNDDLEIISQSGITIISDDEAKKLPDSIERIEFKDFDYDRLKTAFEHFGVSLSDLYAVAIAVFDHGNAPSGISDRQFRFDYLNERIRKTNRLSGFAYLTDDIPPIMTRMQSVAQCTESLQLPVMIMDTAPAAILGATLDSAIQKKDQNLIVNIGNLHTLAFRLGSKGIEGVFEHHTGILDCARLDNYLADFSSGKLTNRQVFDDHGHGALLYTSKTYPISKESQGLTIIGPRRKMMAGSKFTVYNPSPFGDMMVCGCFGMLSAISNILPDTREHIDRSFFGTQYNSTAAWDLS